MTVTIEENKELLKNFDVEIEKFNGWLKEELVQPPLTNHEKAIIKTYLVYVYEHENVPTE
jgi:hypothetical protein